MLSTRLLTSLAVGVTIFSIGFLYALYTPKIYQATGVVEMLSHGDNPITAERGLEAFQLPELAVGVDKRLNDTERLHLLAPYKAMTFDGQLRPASSILLAFSDFQQLRDTLMIRVSFEHPDPIVAATACNLYMKEYIDYWLIKEIDKSMKAVEALRVRADTAKQRVEAIEIDLANIWEKRANAKPEEEQTLDIKYNELLETLKTEQEAFRKLIEEMTQEKAMVRLGSAKVRILEEAKIPTTHIRPNIPLWTAFSALTGLLSALLCYRLMRSAR